MLLSDCDIYSISWITEIDGSSPHESEMFGVDWCIHWYWLWCCCWKIVTLLMINTAWTKVSKAASTKVLHFGACFRLHSHFLHTAFSNKMLNAFMLSPLNGNDTLSTNGAFWVYALPEQFQCLLMWQQLITVSLGFSSVMLSYNIRHIVLLYNV